jgi:ABC-type glycerol-3-phosphate transport system permease component
MAVASLRPGVPPDIASLTPTGPFGLGDFAEAWASGNFPLWYLNTVLMCGGILAVQLVTVSMAGYAFARLRFPGSDLLFSAFLLQLLLIPPLLIVPILRPWCRCISTTAYWAPKSTSPQTRLSHGCWFRKKTIAGISRNGRNA